MEEARQRGTGAGRVWMQEQKSCWQTMRGPQGRREGAGTTATAQPTAWSRAAFCQGVVDKVEAPFRRFAAPATDRPGTVPPSHLGFSFFSTFSSGDQDLARLLLASPCKNSLCAPGEPERGCLGRNRPLVKRSITSAF